MTTPNQLKSTLKKEIATGGFNYKIHLRKKIDGVVFDIIDTSVCVAGEFEPDIICSGKIDAQGRCKIIDLYCDSHAAISLGTILSLVYDSLSEVNLSTA